MATGNSDEGSPPNLSSPETPASSNSGNGGSNNNNRSTRAMAISERAKKRRLAGACDLCKRRKIRCDSAQMMGNRCSNCITAGQECTHIELAKNLGPAKGYVENLEQRLEKMEHLLQKLIPGVDLEKELSDANSGNVLESYVENNILIPRNDDDNATDSLAIRFNKLVLDPTSRRFIGKSSEYYLIQAIVNNSGHDVPAKDLKDQLRTWKNRDEFWEARPWQQSRLVLPDPEYAYPTDDLLWNLVELYFVHINPYFPLLHRPTFEKSVRENLHITDKFFGGVLLLVCANAARYSDDPRVLLQSHPDTLSAGWRWFSQVTVVRSSMVNRANLYELQQYCLVILYQASTALGYGNWVLVGIGLRLGQDVGAHRRRKLVGPTAENELWKRAFWILVMFDRTSTAFSGRSCTFHEADYDLDYPVEVDDEYWDNPDPYQCFQQPPGKLSSITPFVQMLKLMKIFELIQTTTYAIRKEIVSLREIRASEQQIIADIDSALNDWADSVPTFLKWDSSRSDQDKFFWHSLYLYITYYYLQIFAHRPFIPTTHAQSHLSYPSLTICTNAARSVAHIIELPSAHELLLRVPLPHIVISIFTSGLILMLSTWSKRHTTNPRDDSKHVQALMDHLKESETRWNHGGKLWDILSALSGVRPHSNSPQTQKRRRDDDSPAPTASTLSPSRFTFHGNAFLQDLSPFGPRYTDLGSAAADMSILNEIAGPGTNNNNPTTGYGDINFFGTGTSETTAEPDLSFLFTDIPMGSGPGDPMSTLWTSTPAGLDSLEDWGPYIDNLSQVMQYPPQ